jgi:hypothetical protein
MPPSDERSLLKSFGVVQGFSAPPLLFLIMRLTNDPGVMILTPQKPQGMSPVHARCRN